jgi:potassium efflux system protein
LRVARDNADVLPYPEPEALFRGFGDSSLDFELRAFTEAFRGFLPVTSDLLVAITAALEEAGIEIPFPQRDLHLRSVDPGIGAGRSEAADDAPRPPTASDDEADSDQ